MNAVPRSEKFDDVYFSAEDGLAETCHVFLDGNDLPARWQDRSVFTIAETGFGTGLNFLSTWKQFEETARPDQNLDYISFEKYPLSAEDIEKYLHNYKSELGGYLSELIELYPLVVPGFHKITLAGQVTLLLVFDDVNAALPQLEAEVDCWFLDGFKPSANPEMWTDTMFSQMARLSVPGATFATFTAAGGVRRGLDAAGFTVRKAPGFGRKREMLVGKKR